MATLTLPCIDGGEVVITHRTPRQTEVLALLSRVAGDTSVAARYDAALEWLASLTLAVDGDDGKRTQAADIIDERVSYQETVRAANQILSSRLPPPELMGNSEPGDAS